MTHEPLASPDMWRLQRLASRIAALNPDAGEIGEGMLVQLIGEARHIVGYVTPEDGQAVSTPEGEEGRVTR